jgi:hypothetical protein
MSFCAFIALVRVSIRIRPGGDSRNETIGDADDRYCRLREPSINKKGSQNTKRGVRSFFDVPEVVSKDHFI